MMVENSHLIQVLSQTRTMWRGTEWFSFSLDIKSNLRSQSGILRAVVESVTSSKVYAPWETEMVKAKFEKNSSEDHPWNALLVDHDPYNKLYVKVHKGLFKEGDTFKVIVAAQEVDGTNIVFGASQSIA